MRIAHITTDFKPILGGQETYIANLIKILAEAGHEQVVYQHFNGEKSPELHFVPKILKTNKRHWLNVWSYNLLVNKYYFELKNSDCLIVHFPFHFPAVMWHKKVVVLSHGVEWSVPPRSASHKLREKLARFAFGHARIFVANDTDFFRQMGLNTAAGERLFERLDGQRWFIPNCVDTNHFYEAEPYPNLQKLNPILLPRNINPQRGITLAIEAFAGFVKVYPETNLIVVGDFQDFEYKCRVFSLINQLTLAGKVLFLGNVSWQNMPRIYASSLMSLVPSIYSEGTSLSALESMACGIPVVSTNIGGLADLPAYKTNPDAESFCNGMIEAFKQQELLGSKQQKIVREQFNLENWSKAWLKAIAMK